MFRFSYDFAFSLRESWAIWYINRLPWLRVEGVPVNRPPVSSGKGVSVTISTVLENS
jgi:hypothetical protein